MPYLILSDASLAFGHVPLLDHAELQLDGGERVALIGRNGTGKSSLLSALAGCGGLDDGKVWQQPGLRVGHGFVGQHEVVGHHAAQVEQKGRDAVDLVRTE